MGSGSVRWQEGSVTGSYWEPRKKRNWRKGMQRGMSRVIGFLASLAFFAIVNLMADDSEELMMDLLYKDECYRVMGACFEVYREKGSGFVEPVYQECLSIELALQEIQFAEQKDLTLSYKSRELKQKHKPDFICYDIIILEIKAVSKLTDEHRAQVHNYLKATGMKLGLLVNFGHYPKVEWERIVRDRIE